MRIYIFSPIRYDFLHQRPQKLADQFRSMSIPVTFIQPSGFKEYLSGNQPDLLGVILSALWFHFLGFVALVVPFVSSRERNCSIPHKDFHITSLPVTFPINRVNSSFLETLTSSIYRQFLWKKILTDENQPTVAIIMDP